MWCSTPRSPLRSRRAWRASTTARCSPPRHHDGGSQRGGRDRRVPARRHLSPWSAERRRRAAESIAAAPGEAARSRRRTERRRQVDVRRADARSAAAPQRRSSTPTRSPSNAGPTIRRRMPTTPHASPPTPGHRLIELGRSFIAETVFSHPSKLELIDTAHAAGYTVVVHVVLIPEELAVQRVSHRVSAGGHDVPEGQDSGTLPTTVGTRRHCDHPSRLGDRLRQQHSAGPTHRGPDELWPHRRLPSLAGMGTRTIGVTLAGVAPSLPQRGNFSLWVEMISFTRVATWGNDEAARQTPRRAGIARRGPSRGKAAVRCARL